MKGPVWFGRLTNALMNLILGVCISVVLLGVMGVLSVQSLLFSVVVSFVAGYTIGDLVPAMDWGRKLAEVLHVKSPVFGYIIMAVVLGAVMGLCLICLLGYINNFNVFGWEGVVAFISQWILIVPALAAVLVIVALKPAMKISSLISGFDPQSAQHADS